HDLEAGVGFLRFSTKMMVPGGAGSFLCCRRWLVRDVPLHRVCIADQGRGLIGACSLILPD
ncbi:hypothetical protein, partial [Dietzia lutea]|uniref:hypothetical protein n=1 Tax=Dietzia lutea TaxID=546160 RepID=UPI001F19E7AC